MNKTFTKEQLATWIAGLQKDARNDKQFDMIFFPPTTFSKFSIIGGWTNMFGSVGADLFCQSKSRPSWTMCVKIVEHVNDLAFTGATAFDSWYMHTAKDGKVEDNCIILQWDDDPEEVAEFFMIEWERLMDKVNNIV